MTVPLAKHHNRRLYLDVQLAELERCRVGVLPHELEDAEITARELLPVVRSVRYTI